MGAAEVRRREKVVQCRGQQLAATCWARRLAVDNCDQPCFPGTSAHRPVSFKRTQDAVDNADTSSSLDS